MPLHNIDSQIPGARVPMFGGLVPGTGHAQNHDWSTMPVMAAVRLASGFCLNLHCLYRSPEVAPSVHSPLKVRS